MPLVQLHHQFKDGKADTRAQREIANHAKMSEFLKETKELHPLPGDASWLAVLEKSPLFVLTDLTERVDMSNEDTQ